MKRLSAVLLFGAICIFTTGCGSPSPSSVALKFYEALQKGDMETMGKYATSETIKTLGPLLSKAQPMIAAMGKPKVVSQKIDGDNAVVVLKFENEEDPENVELIKIDGKWRVQITLDFGKGK